MESQHAIIDATLRAFCLEFVRYPYLCYTEHGLHALFYTQLYTNLPEEQRFTEWAGQRVCVIQKEYPTAGMLDKSRRQHWDIGVVKLPPTRDHQSDYSDYDTMRLSAAIEFGLNEGGEHILDDLRRLAHPDAHLDRGIVVQLYRLSARGRPTSARDISGSSRRMVPIAELVPWTQQYGVEIWYALADPTGQHQSGVWRVVAGVTELIADGGPST